ncbi:hypothetical protein DM02DRAFT_648319 [Periconia macrospinosa]|uniref:Uncharacterized protein n=1 Tax=Periconia macrospinosa TaxID=97972 RepID=A0A2V1EG33_9PLEO|nr:hypothetical protein DM02DRAFT_648319 [Periconia macrospinosa]
MGSLSPRRPGILLVHPRLREPSEESAGTFLRWTKLHYRDLLSIPDTPALGHTTRTLRFVGKLGEPYFYTTNVEDIGILQSEAYYKIPRQLDLENTRALSKDEEAVGKAGQVWDVVDTIFGVFEYVGGWEKDVSGLKQRLESPERLNTVQIESYQTLPLPLSTTLTNNQTPRNYLIALTIRNVPTTLNPESAPSDQPAPRSVLALQEALLRYLASGNGPSTISEEGVKIATSVYRYAGQQAQPAEHPLIDVGATGEWLVVALLVAPDVQATGLDEEVVEWVDRWDAHAVAGKEDVSVEWRTWSGDLFMQ